MLDVKILRTEMDRVQQLLQQRGADLSDLGGFIDLDKQRREKLQETEQLKSRRNQVSQEVAMKKKSGESADDVIAEMKNVSNRIKELDEEIRNLEQEINDILLSLPNLTHESVPVGKDEADNVEVRRWGEPTSFSFEPKPHWELGEQLDILDFESSSRVSGSRFVFYKGLGARLERALIQFMMDLHSDEHGYQEILPPMIVNEDSMIGTGQLPKFKDDAFSIQDSHFYLVPTAEVPVTNYHRESIMDMEELPKAYVAYSACFRSEAGSAGRDTRGLIRQHQFNKVELVHLTTPEASYEVLERLTTHAEAVLQKLGLPYRILSLCTGDIGFSAAKTYDLEVWLPSSNTYREISSCSNTEDFQARRANIRFKRDKKSKPEFVHTLNGSGLAVGRTVAAIMENFQQEDGSILVPEVLRPYMNGKERIQ